MRDLLKSKLATAGLLLILALTTVVAARIIWQKYQVDREISRLERRVAEVSRGNVELSELIEYYNTEEYVQRVARETLNLKKPDEFTVVLPPSDRAGGEMLDQQAQPNRQKWYDYFFK